MTADLHIEAVAFCPNDGTQVDMRGLQWICPRCRTTWNADGSGASSAADVIAAYDDEPQRPTDSTSATVLDRPQPD